MLAAATLVLRKSQVFKCVRSSRRHPWWVLSPGSCALYSSALTRSRLMPLSDFPDRPLPVPPQDQGSGPMLAFLQLLLPSVPLGGACHSQVWDARTSPLPSHKHTQLDTPVFLHQLKKIDHLLCGPLLLWSLRLQLRKQ